MSKKPLFFKNYSLAELMYLQIRLNKTQFFLGSIKKTNTIRKGFKDENKQYPLFIRTIPYFAKASMRKSKPTTFFGRIRKRKATYPLIKRGVPTLKGFQRGSSCRSSSLKYMFLQFILHFQAAITSTSQDKSIPCKAK